MTLKPQLMVTLRDIQNLVLWVLGEGDNPKWIFVKVRLRCCAQPNCICASTTDRAPCTEQAPDQEGGACGDARHQPQPL